MMRRTPRRTRPDRSKIEGAAQLRWWARHLKVSEAELSATLARVGNSAAAVRKELVPRAAAGPRIDPDSPQPAPYDPNPEPTPSEAPQRDEPPGVAPFNEPGPMGEPLGIPPTMPSEIPFSQDTSGC